MDKDVLDRAGLPMDCGEGLEALSREWSKQWARGIVSSQAEEECLRLREKRESRREEEEEELSVCREWYAIKKKINSLMFVGGKEQGRSMASLSRPGLISFAVGTRSFGPCQALGAYKSRVLMA